MTRKVSCWAIETGPGRRPGWEVSTLSDTVPGELEITHFFGARARERAQALARSLQPTTSLVMPITAPVPPPPAVAAVRPMAPPPPLPPGLVDTSKTSTAQVSQHIPRPPAPPPPDPS